MDTTNQMVQAAGPRTMGAAAVTSVTMNDLLTERTMPAVKVTWTTVRQFEAEIPLVLWEKLDGNVGDTATPLDEHLEDLEKLAEIHAGSDVIERGVVEAEPVR